MATPATTKFFSTLDLLCCLAEQIVNTKSLWSLCLVNRVFNEAFTPALYSELRFNSYDPDEDQKHLIQLASGSCPHLKHTKLLSFHRATEPDRNDENWLDHLAFFDALVLKIFTQTPMLETFELIAGLLSCGTLRKLHECCPRLKDLSIIYPHFSLVGDWLQVSLDFEALDKRSKYMSYVAVYHDFSNLRELCLINIEGTYASPGWGSALARILAKSPGLQSLSLSALDEAVRENSRASKIGCKYFLQSLCKMYAATGAKPLRLRKLHLGLGFVLWAGKRTPEIDLQISPLTWALFDQPEFIGYPATYLSKLTTLDCLEEAHVENEDALAMTNDGAGALELRANFGQEWACGARDGIAWGTFLPEWTPNLRRLTWANTSDSIVEFLSGLDEKYAANLALAHFIDDQGDYESEYYTDESYHSPDDNVLARDDEEDGALGSIFDDGVQGQDESGAVENQAPDDSIATAGPFGYYSVKQIPKVGDPPDRPGLGFRMIKVNIEFENEHTERGPKWILEDLVAAQANTLQGLAIHMGHFGTSMLGPYLARLPKLTSLLASHENEGFWDSDEPESDAVIAKMCRKQYPMMKEAAVELARHSKSLRFIKVGRVGWEIIRSPDGRECRWVDLDVNEEQRIELFRMGRRRLGRATSDYESMA